jgi:hypothetical protein
MLGSVALSQDRQQSLAATPPMGWNSWNKFACNVSQDLIHQVADAMVASGMKDAGYQYVIIDDCWQVDRDGNGNIVPDPRRFPSGMKALADYVHARGLKFGLYSDAGTKTCQGRPGSRGYEFQDARQYAAWGVDYLKYDWCSTSTQDARSSYEIMRAALDASGRPIVFSICEWGTSRPWLWAKAVGNLWRTTGDISDKWEGHTKWPMGRSGISRALERRSDRSQISCWPHSGLEPAPPWRLEKSFIAMRSVITGCRSRRPLFSNAVIWYQVWYMRRPLMP